MKLTSFFLHVNVAINIPYEFVISVLSHHGLNQNDNAPALKPMQLTGLLHDIYFAAEKCRHFSQCDDFNLERCTAMLSNFFWCIFDPYVFSFFPFKISIFKCKW